MGLVLLLLAGVVTGTGGDGDGGDGGGDDMVLLFVMILPALF